jgi:ribonuclease HII
MRPHNTISMEKKTRIARRFRHEHQLWQNGTVPIAGVDEAGRGPLAGPVVAAAVVLPCEWFLKGLPRQWRGLNDSKQLTAEDRDRFFCEITSHPDVLHAAAHVEVELIDRINILQATHRAMNLALAQLTRTPQHVLVDGLEVKSMTFPQTPLVDGDCLSYSIAAASVLAKVTRDRMMADYHRQYPAYGFDEHKGYGTPAHLAAIKKHGPCPIHRRTFSPFRMLQTEFLNFPDEALDVD